MSEKSHKIRNAFEHIAKQASPILKRFWIPKRSPSDPKEAAGAETEQQTAINNVHHAGQPVPLVESCYDEPDATREGNDTYQKQKEDNHNEVNWEERNFWATVFLTLLLLVVSIIGVYFAQDIGYQQNVIANKQAEIANTQADIANKQLKEMESGSEDTKKLAQAAVNQADATKAIAESANTQANAALALAGASQEQRQEMANQSGLMADSLTELRKSIDVAQLQANASIIQAKASSSQANTAEKSLIQTKELFSFTQRPSLGIASIDLTSLSSGERPTVRLVVRNSGNSPAIKTETRTSIAVVRAVGNESTPCPEFPPITEMIGLISQTVIPVNGVRVASSTAKNPLSAALADGIPTGRTWIFVYLNIKYKSIIGGEFFIEYYARYDPTRKGFAECAIHNDAN